VSTDLVAELRELCAIAAPSGREEAMSAHIAALFRRCADRVEVDWLGNVAATFTEGPPTLLFFAHMDEIGFVVRLVTERGFLRVERLGGVSRRAALGSAVTVLGTRGPVPGVLGLTSHHLTPPDEQHTIPPVESWYVDIGAADAAEAQALGVEVGSFVAFSPNFRAMGSGLIASKALDDRVGCWVLAELARRFAGRPPPRRVVLLASVQEEFHLRGLIPAVARARPDVAVGLDVTPAADTPDLEGRNAIRLRGGPAVKVMDFHGRGSLNGLLVPRFLVEWVEAAAGEAGIATQREVVVGVVTDGTYLGALDVPAAALSIPARYTHSSQEVVAVSDVEAAADLCEHLARGPGPPPYRGDVPE
jgi:putative aminopeptidase FrvX